MKCRHTNKTEQRKIIILPEVVECLQKSNSKFFSVQGQTVSSHYIVLSAEKLGKEKIDFKMPSDANGKTNI